MEAVVPWFPESLQSQVAGADELTSGWRYVVLEEVVDGTALLLSWPWPLADAGGRLTWTVEDDREPRDASVLVRLLRHRLYEPAGLRRTPRVGDTYAALHADTPGWGRPGLAGQDGGAGDASDGGAVERGLDGLFPDRVLDVSADARAASRLAYQGSLVRALPKGEVDRELVRAAATARRRLGARELLPGPRGGDAPRPGGR